MSKIKFAPREVFEQILEYAVIPTFDLVIEMPQGGIVIVYRKIQPYANQWALPGLRMMKPENINDTLIRIASQELGLKIDPEKKRFLGQFVGRFRTEHNRQDISTAYAACSKTKEIKINQSHFSKYCVITSPSDIPARMGAMYRFYLNSFFKTE
ncbi:NUDIX domain-containing protein [Patescibacteria group bacterium]|nr:MAG: NUDIX domain-containing protein [Patescibacteria group bacterium]